MHVLFPKKKYDPTPFSWPLRIWHGIFGCPADRLENANAADTLDLFFTCPCGLVYNLGRCQHTKHFR